MELDSKTFAATLDSSTNSPSGDNLADTLNDRQKHISS